MPAFKCFFYRSLQFKLCFLIKTGANKHNKFTFLDVAIGSVTQMEVPMQTANITGELTASGHPQVNQIHYKKSSLRI